MNSLQEIRFYVHDEEHSVKISDVKPETTLNYYLRQKAHLTGTKNMCFEGGCGTCIVSVSAKHPVTNDTVNFAVNSCLVSIFSCHGWKIQTVEGIGNPLNGFHKIQKTLAHFNGTQCGFCTPGMVMNMYALLEENSNLTMKEMENSFGGNLCRCTGYRPILSAFKSLCKDADPTLIGTVVDIEDMRACQSDLPCKKLCKTPCFKKEQVCFDLGDSKWFKVYNIDEIFTIFQKNSKASYMLVSGNTARGVFKSPPASDVYIDVTEVKELLKHVVTNKELILGGNMSLTEAMNLFYKLGAENPNFSYLTGLGDHIDLIANVPVRNTGSIAGNLTMKHSSHGFPSDVYLILETVGSTIRTIGKSKAEMSLNLIDYLNVDMRHRVIKNIVLPALDNTYVYRSYKIMPRAQNAHAIVNAGFLVKLKDGVVEKVSIVYGNINSKFIHATETEKFLVGKKLFDNNTLQGAYKLLEKEITPDHILPDPAPEFRRQLAIALFYKFVLSIAPESALSPRNKTGGNMLHRNVTKGSQDYETNESLYPLTQAIPKIEALAQTSGQAEYINDFPDRPGQLYAALVLSDATPFSKIKSISPNKALKLNGVVAFYAKDDIPGRNTFTPKECQFPIDEELFCSGIIQYYSQPIGVVVAESQALAEEAAKIVEITYEPSSTKPLFTVRQILEAGNTSKITQEIVVKPTKTGTDIKQTIKGKFDVSWQYHFHMETQCCSVVPTEDGFNMYPSTQAMDQVHIAASVVLNLPANKFNIFVRRIGGAYGGKISRSALCSSAAALAAYKLHRPVKITLPLEVNMQVIGKRLPCSSDYEVGINSDGKVQYLNSTIYSDYGKGGNEFVVGELLELYRKKYVTDGWHIVVNTTKTDTHAGTWCRAPGTTEGLAMIESLMDHIAYSVNKDPLEVRVINMDETKEAKMLSFIDELKQWAEIDKRKKQIAEFNKNNRWFKKGISVVPMKYPLFNFGNWSVIVSVYKSDGSVSVAHGGIEMGQGINTKVAQVCAYALGIPLEKVSVKPSNNLISPNGFATGGSITSEAVCYGILKACDILLERMKPVREKLNNPTWEALIMQCYLDFVDLTTTFMYAKNSPAIKDYIIYGMCATEVEVDILTGKHLITRVDLMEDTGNSMSPEIDIGQVEGAYVMGQGYWTTEEVVMSEKGEILSKNTWTYKPPGAKDIPLDFRVKFPKNNPNPIGILKSKAVAEPPLCMTCSVPLAIRNAVASARSDSNPSAEKWYPINGPSTVENTFVNSLHDYKQYIL